MGWLVRPRPCPCGSGRAARDCCGRFKRLSESDAARAYMHRQARAARDLLAPFSPSGMDGLRRELALLPASQPLIRDALGGRAGHEVSKLVMAAARRAEADGDALISAVVARPGMFMARVALEKAVIARREDGALDEHFAAAAILDLDGPASVLLAAAVRQAAAEIRATGEVSSQGEQRRQRATITA
jgi:hypothetical protein